MTKENIMSNESVIEKLAALRESMRKHDLSAWIIPSSDAHNSEYAAEHWQGRSWISGFTGSAGTVVILKDKAACWIDGRYFIQGAQELQGSSIDMMKMGLPDSPTVTDWIVEQCAVGNRVGFDGKVMSHNFLAEFKAKSASKNIDVITNVDLLDEVWLDRPALPSSQIFALDIQYAGKSRAEKLNDVRAEMKSRHATHHIITTLDDIAWLYNYRATDIANSPVSLAWTLVSEDKAELFIDSKKVPTNIKTQLENDGVTLAEYTDMEKAIRALPNSASVCFDPEIVNCHFTSLIPSACKKIHCETITTLMKAIKNDVEIAHFDECHRKDGAAVVKFMKWLDENVPSGDVTELTGEARLQAFREEIDTFRGLSFPTIPGYAENGALMHYRCSESTSKTLGTDNFFLFDSGGLYWDGTTDITRTMNFGDLSDQQKTDYTLVLKGHINMSQAIFMKGCTGHQLDTLARQPMWKHSINYACGTGHGVGFYLNVHEGPQGASIRTHSASLVPGMNITNEPGIYREGQYGIRIENIMFVEEHTDNEFGTFYKLRPSTMCPINTRPIVREMLSNDETAWLNDYHAEVYKELCPYLTEAEQTWLKDNTQPI